MAKSALTHDLPVLSLVPQSLLNVAYNPGVHCLPHTTHPWEHSRRSRPCIRGCREVRAETHACIDPLSTAIEAAKASLQDCGCCSRGRTARTSRIACIQPTATHRTFTSCTVATGSLHSERRQVAFALPVTAIGRLYCVRRAQGTTHLAPCSRQPHLYRLPGGNTSLRSGKRQPVSRQACRMAQPKA